MSAATARRAAQAAGTTSAAGTSAAPVVEDRPQLRVLRRPPIQAPRGPFVVAVGAVLTLGLLGVLLLNTVSAKDAFTISALQARSEALADQEQALTQQVAAADSPQQLADRAHALGMVPNVNPVFIRLSDGKVLGVPVAAKAPPVVRTPVALRTKAATAGGTTATTTATTSTSTKAKATSSGTGATSGTTTTAHRSSTRPTHTTRTAKTTRTAHTTTTKAGH